MIVLIVEDQALIRQLVRKYLGAIPEVTEIREADNGRDAVLKAKKWTDSPDLVLIDIDMPHMDGLTLLGKIRQGQVKNLAPDIAAFMLTGKVDEIYQISADRRNATGYLTKPISLDALVGAIATAQNRA